MGYYTDAVNNLTGAGNALGSAISTAAIAGTHLKQQAQANELNYVKQQSDLSEDLNNTNEQLGQQDQAIKTEELKKSGLEMLGKDYDEKIDQMEDTHMTDESLIRDWEENMQAVQDVKKKIAAMEVTRNQIDNHRIKLEIQKEALDKANPKLAKKYKEIK